MEEVKCPSHPSSLPPSFSGLWWNGNEWLCQARSREREKKREEGEEEGKEDVQRNEGKREEGEEEGKEDVQRNEGNKERLKQKKKMKKEETKKRAKQIIACPLSLLCFFFSVPLFYVCCCY
jgi:hypothetical protein